MREKKKSSCQTLLIYFWGTLFDHVFVQSKLRVSGTFRERHRVRERLFVSQHMALCLAHGKRVIAAMSPSRREVTAAYQERLVLGGCDVGVSIPVAERLHVRWVVPTERA